MPGVVEKTYKTKCNLFVKQEVFVVAIMSRVYYGGKQHICITGKAKQCQDCDKLLFKAYGGHRTCSIEETGEVYNDQQSINKIIREMNAKFYKEKKKLEKGHWFGCPNILQEFDKAVKKYDLRKCKEFNCLNEICIITGEKRDTELVNIFYDLDKTTRQGFLVFEKWERDLKYFSTRVARDIAEKYIPIIQKEEPEKLNLRIQTRKTRSLEDDLERLRFNSNLIIEEQ